MNSRTQVISIDGIVGPIEMAIDLPDQLKSDPSFMVRGFALVVAMSLAFICLGTKKGQPKPAPEHVSAYYRITITQLPH